MAIIDHRTNSQLIKTNAEADYSKVMWFFKRSIKNKEEGFTIVEIMIVIVIIGILTAAGVLIWKTQEKNGINASIKSDLKNAATTLTAEATRSGGKFPQFLPASVKISPNNIIQIDQNNSNSAAYCLVGYNTSDSNTKFYYSNYGGGLLNDTTQSCPSLNSFSNGSSAIVDTGSGPLAVPVVGGIAGSWANIRSADLSTAKVAVVAIAEAQLAQAKQDLKTMLLGYGFYQVDFYSESAFQALDLSTYKLIILTAGDNSVTKETYDHALAYYQTGGLVLADGNNTDKTKLGYFITSNYNAGTLFGYIPTGNAITPAFPYLFDATSWTFSDQDGNTHCPSAIANATAIATWPVSGHVDCITGFASVSAGGGRWVQYSRITVAGGNDGGDVDTSAWASSIVSVAMDWLVTL